MALSEFSTTHNFDAKRSQTYLQHFRAALWGNLRLIGIGLGGIWNAFFPKQKRIQFDIKKRSMKGLKKGDIITVFGATGFLGRRVVQALAEKGYRIRAAVRRPDLAGHLQPMGAVGQIMPIQANLRYPESINFALEGADAAINLVGILEPRGNQTFDALHVNGPASIASLAAENGLKTVIHVSAIGADKRSNSRYGRSKATGERAVLEAFPDAVIIRPSIIFGAEDNFFNRFAKIAKFSPVMPLLGGGKTKMQPVFVGDVANAVAAVISGQGNAGTVYELGGTEILTFRELMERTLDYTDRERSFFPMPFWLAKVQAFFMKILPSPPITVDQVRMLQRDNIVSAVAIENRQTLAGLGITTLHSIALEVPPYLEQYKPKGQYAHYRVL